MKSTLLAYYYIVSVLFAGASYAIESDPNTGKLPLKVVNDAIYEWMPTPTIHNFGDYLGRLIGREIFEEEAWRSILCSKTERYFFIGSVIGDWTIMHTLNHHKKHPVLVGCGVSYQPLSVEAATKAEFLGCRGFLSQAALKTHNVEVDVIGDPAALLPLIVPKDTSLLKQRILIPHLGDPRRHQYTPEEYGVDLIIQAETFEEEDLTHMINIISSASFVLAGAMHAGIVAYAYNVPFAFFSNAQNGHVDSIFKLKDFCSSIGLTTDDLSLCSDYSSSTVWYQEKSRLFRKNKLTRILSCYANIGEIKDNIWKKAAELDVQHLEQGMLLESAAPLDLDCV